MKLKLEYVWLDGYKPEQNLRSKIKIVEYEEVKNAFLDGNFPMWNFDGSSTNQADGSKSDCILKPVRHYTPQNFPLENNTVYILCEVFNSDETPHESNKRSLLSKNNEDFWFGFEQEYFIYDKKTKCILGHDQNNLEPQGKYYCGVGEFVVGRDFVDEHLNMCLNYGINITGVNAEVALGQWEYQVFSKGSFKSGDDLWMSRYFLNKISEKFNYNIDLHPKPLQKGSWNGSGLHANFSNDKMRNEGGEEYFNSIFSSLESTHFAHITDYGSDNELRLTGKHETQNINKFTWGISDRGASIRIPIKTAKEWKGYLEDRRPGSNADPYKIIYQIVKSINNANIIDEIKYKINFKIDSDKTKDKFNGILSNEELLKEYQNDENYPLDDRLMDCKNNVSSVDINSK